MRSPNSATSWLRERLEFPGVLYFISVLSVCVVGLRRLPHHKSDWILHCFVGLKICSSPPQPTPMHPFSLLSINLSCEFRLWAILWLWTFHKSISNTTHGTLPGITRNTPFHTKVHLEPFPKGSLNIFLGEVTHKAFNLVHIFKMPTYWVVKLGNKRNLFSPCSGG